MRDLSKGLNFQITTSLYELLFRVKQPDGRGYMGLHAKTKGVNIVNDLVMLLEEEEALSYVINE